jgi:lipoprotein-releasing system permease protein
MPYEVFLAFRYLRSRHKRRLAQVTAGAAMLGIALGVAALIIAFALANGFRDEMRDKILQGTAHISVLRADGEPITEQNLVTQVAQTAGVKHASITSYDGVIARGPKGSTYAVLRGIEKSQEAELTSWIREGSFERIFGGASDVPELVMGTELATRLGLKSGDYLQIVPTNSANVRSRRVRVAGLFKSGLFEYDSTWVFVSGQTAQSFAGESHATAVITAQVNDVDKVEGVAAAIRAQLNSGYTIIDWKQANQPLFAALALERRMGLIIIGLIIVIAALNITTMLILIVSERRHDIAVLSALGATPKSISLLFVIEGTVVGALGAVSGVVLGLTACFVANKFKLVSLPADVYSISHVPLNAGAKETLLAALIALALSVLATLYPSRAAAGMRPIESLRDSG